MLALSKGDRRRLTLRNIIDHFIKHRNEIVVRRTKFDLTEAEKRAHILEGTLSRSINIDEIIQLIKKAKDVPTAQAQFDENASSFPKIQAKAILDMRLQRLTGLERKKVEDEYKETIKIIER